MSLISPDSRNGVSEEKVMTRKKPMANPLKEFCTRAAPERQRSEEVGLLFRSSSWFADIMQTAWPEVSLKKFIRACVSVGCFCGFTFQTWVFLSFYLKYPTVVDVQVKRPEEMELPAVTFCRRIQDYETVCDNTERKDPCCTFNQGKNSGGENGKDDAPWKTLLLSCEMYSKGRTHNCRFTNISRITVPDESGLNVDCYILFSKMNSLEVPRLEIPKRKKTLLQLTLSLSASGESVDANVEKSVSSAQVSIHSPYTLVNPFNDGFELEPGYLYILQISLKEKSLLESPYDTNCTDYKKQWIQRGKNGPLSHQMCMELCILNLTLQKYNCTLVEILYPHEKRKICSDSLKELNEESFSTCHSSCSEECELTTYEYEIQRRRMNDRVFKSIASNIERQHFINTTTVLQFFLKRPEILTFTYRPQFQFFETFSYIGGLLGIWLGISFVAVLDFIEAVANLSLRIHQRISFKKRRLQRSTSVES